MACKAALRKQLDLVSSMPVWLVLVIALVMVFLIGYVDYLTGDYSILIFYAVPVGLAAWSMGVAGVAMVAVTAGAARYISDCYSYANSSVRYWNCFEDMLFLIIFGLLISAVKRLIDSERPKTS